ncbi:MAG: HupE/UreJ family protein [Acidobacteria bacterium]|nr:HupE/UreJ family protein [Acidobacteriota bacterium]
MRSGKLHPPRTPPRAACARVTRREATSATPGVIRAARARWTRCALVALATVLALLAPSAAAAHDVENTHVLVVLEADDTYRVDVLNDADWLWLQVHPGATAADLPAVAARNRELAELVPAFATGMTVVFDGDAVPPEGVTYVPPPTEDRSGPWGLAEPGLIRLTGTVPPGAATFQFGYDRIIDEYPMTVTRAAGAPATRWLQPSQLSPALAVADLVPLTPLQVAVQYLGLGYTHILPKGLDHILFVLGLFLLSTKLRPLLFQVTAFTVAHTITLALTIYGVFALPPAVVEPLIALSIAYVAVENLLTAELKPSRIALVFAFGLLHGMGFAGVLADLGLPRGELVTALVTFNVGVEVGQLTVIAAAFAAVAAVRDRAWYRNRVVVPLSLGIAAVGLFWTVERVLAA